MCVYVCVAIDFTMMQQFLGMHSKFMKCILTVTADDIVSYLRCTYVRSTYVHMYNYNLYTVQPLDGSCDMHNTCMVWGDPPILIN